VVPSGVLGRNLRAVVANNQIMAYRFGIDVPWQTLLITIPVVNILSTLPINWNGLGVRENGYVFFLTRLILSHEQAIAFGHVAFGHHGIEHHWRRNILLLS